MYRDIDNTKPRPVIKTSLGCHVLGASSPHPDPSDLETMLDGASRRFCRKPPSPDPQVMKRFRLFVAKWLKKHMTPLASDTDTSFETWIESTPYPLHRKNELRRKWAESEGCIRPSNIRDKRGVINRYCKVKSFQKDEVYPQYKAARGINSRTDEFKVRVGPIFKLIEKRLFSMPYFIKHTPVDERAEEIKRELYQAAANIISTDYTSFESLFTRELMETCEFQLYDYMTQDLPDTEWIQIVKEVMGGDNYCEFREKFTIRVEATRMSGEMCTSLGNSFTNLMALLFVAKETGMKKVRARIEGDDGIATFYGPYPTAEDFAKIGLIIKIEKHESLTEASFCGIIADEDEMINVTDPIDSLLQFGWTTREYYMSNKKKKLELLKAKSLSLAYQYPGCPILDSLAQYGLRMCENSKVYYKNLNEYERGIFLKMFKKYKDKIPHKEVGFKTRLLVERRFGISVDDQVSIERYLDNKTDLSPIDHPAILSNCHPDTIDYFNRYVFCFEDRNASDCPIGDNYSQEKAFNIFDLYYGEKEQETEEASFGQAKGKTWYKRSCQGSRDSTTAPTQG